MLEKLEKSLEVAIIATEEVFKTYELICLDKLKEIGRPMSARDWSFAMGYTHRSSLAKIIRRIKERYPRVARYYRIEYDSLIKELSYRENAERKGLTESLDGSYMLRTDRTDTSDDEIWRTYSLLTRCENAFRNMKSPLCEKPIFHQLKRRVQTHIFLCILVYHLLVAIEKTLSDEGIHTSWLTGKDTLKTHQVATVILPTTSGEILKIRKGANAEPEHLEIYKSLKIPSQVMKPVKNMALFNIVTE